MDTSIIDNIDKSLTHQDKEQLTYVASGLIEGLISTIGEDFSLLSLREVLQESFCDSTNDAIVLVAILLKEIGSENHANILLKEVLPSNHKMTLNEFPLLPKPNCHKVLTRGFLVRLQRSLDTKQLQSFLEQLCDKMEANSKNFDTIFDVFLTLEQRGLIKCSDDPREDLDFIWNVLKSDDFVNVHEMFKEFVKKEFDPDIAHKVMTENTSLIKQSIGLEYLAVKMLERRIITDIEKRDVVTDRMTGLTSSQRMDELLYKLNTTIKSDGSIFGWFLETIRNQDTVLTRSLVVILEKEYDKKVNSSTATNIMTAYRNSMLLPLTIFLLIFGLLLLIVFWNPLHTHLTATSNSTTTHVTNNPTTSTHITAKRNDSGVPSLEERIWIDGESGEDVVDLCISKLLSCNAFLDDKSFMKRVAHVMSRYGNPPFRLNTDGGIWQVSLFAFNDNLDTDAHIRLERKYEKISRCFGIHWIRVERRHLAIPMYSAIAARLYLSNYAEAIPPAYKVEEQADYWWNKYMKKHESKRFMRRSDFLDTVRTLN